MSTVHVTMPSFNAGELSPLLGARFAVEKVSSGCRKLRNMIPHVHGPAFRRPGTEYIGASAGSGSASSLRGFNFSTSTGFILEFHASGLRVFSNGVLVPLKNPAGVWTTARVWPYASEVVCRELQIVQVNDVCYIAHADHPPRKLQRMADDDWRLLDIEWKWPALGDENTRNDEVASPTTATLPVGLPKTMPTCEWPEFEVPAGKTITFDTTGGVDTSTTAKVGKLWQWVTNKWVLRRTLTWTGSAPTAAAPQSSGTKASPWRITYNEPAKTGGSLRASWAGGSATLAISTAERASLTAVTIPANTDWQAKVVCTATLPAARLYVQRKVGTVWETSGGKAKYLFEIPLKPSVSIAQRWEKFTANTEVRFVWVGRAMQTGDTPSEMRFESVTFPPSKDVTLSCSETSGTGKTLTASEAIFKAGHVGSYWQVSHRRDASSVQIVGNTPTISAESSDSIRVNGKWEVYTYGSWDATLYLERYVSGTWETVRSWVSKKDRNVIATGEEESEVEMRLRVSAGTGEAASGASKPRFLLETSEARVTGLVKITAVGTLNADGKATTATVDVLTALHSTTATVLWAEGAWSAERGYPRAVALHGQRLWFAGTKADPLAMWGSIVNDYESFKRSTLDDSSVKFTPAAQQSNRAQWLASHGENLIMGTSGDEWTVTGGTDRGPITPTSVNIQRRSGYGSQYLQSLLLGDVVVFPQRGGRKLRSVAPRTDGLVWSASDLTVLAEHVTAGGIRQIAAMHHPQSILWAATGDGKLLGMTFEQEQNVFAWHVHETAGSVESVAVVQREDADEVWIQVDRAGVKMIERFDPRVIRREFKNREKLIYVDSAKVLTSVTATATFSGLGHLEGRDVSVLGDGAVLHSTRVVNGAVTLEREVRTLVVGLPFTSEVQPMRVEVPLRDGTSQHRNWRVSRVGVYLHESLGGEAACAPGSKFDRFQFRRVADASEDSPPLFTGDVDIPIESKTGNGADALVRTSDPTPFNLGSITFFLDVYGG